MAGSFHQIALASGSGCAIFDFDETDVRIVDGQRLPDYWGYSTLGFFAPQSAYCVSPESGSHLRQFRDLVVVLISG